MSRFAAIRVRLADDSGAVATMIIVLGSAIFFSLALVVDGGRQLAALTEAQNIADNAARYGSQAVDVQQWRDSGTPIIDTAAANTRVNTYINTLVPPEVDVQGVVVTVVDDTVTVEVTVARRPFFFPGRSAIATESATALDGVSAP